MIESPQAYAHALTSAFLADMARATPLQEEIDRRRVSPEALQRIILRDLRKEVTGEGGPVLFPSLRSFLRTNINIEEARRSAGMGEWAELAETLITAGGKYITARTSAETSETLAKIDLAKQQLALQTAQLQANAARLQLAVAEGFPQAAGAPGATGVPGAPGAAAPESIVPGIPSWIPYAFGGVAILGIGYMIIRGRG